MILWTEKEKRIFINMNTNFINEKKLIDIDEFQKLNVIKMRNGV